MAGLVWRPGVRREGDCRIRGIEGVDDSFELFYGVSRAAGWPSDACCRMDPEWPKDIALSDSPDGALVVVISGRVRSMLDELRVNNCELLPITIRNHKQRVAARDYFIVNPLDICECIDTKRSGAKWNTLNPSVLYGCTALVIRWESVPEHYAIFRLKHWPNVVVVRQRVADTLMAAGFSGLNFIDPIQYTGLV